MKGKRFASIPEIEAATTTSLKGLTKDDFQNYFKKVRNVGTSVWQAKETT
jgi:hypothetical protein